MGVECMRMNIKNVSKMSEHEWVEIKVINSKRMY